MWMRQLPPLPESCPDSPALPLLQQPPNSTPLQRKQQPVTVQPLLPPPQQPQRRPPQQQALHLMVSSDPLAMLGAPLDPAYQAFLAELGGPRVPSTASQPGKKGNKTAPYRDALLAAPTGGRGATLREQVSPRTRDYLDKCDLGGLERMGEEELGKWLSTLGMRVSSAASRAAGKVTDGKGTGKGKKQKVDKG